MKKVFFAFFVWAVAGTMTASAQRTSNSQQSVSMPHVKVFSGSNVVQVPGGQGTLKFTKRGESFTDVVYVDPAGKEMRMTPVKPGTGGAPKPDCKWPIPDACFSIPNNQNIGMCICKPNEISDGKDYTISLLLPAVQAAREAARRSQ